MNQTHDEKVVPEIVKPGELFFLGWAFYESRRFLLEALQEFNLREKLREYWERRKDERDLELEQGYADFIDELQQQKLAIHRTPVLAVVPPSSCAHDPFRSLFIAGHRPQDTEEYEWAKIAQIDS